MTESRKGRKYKIYLVGRSAWLFGKARELVRGAEEALASHRCLGS